MFEVSLICFAIAAVCLLLIWVIIRVASPSAANQAKSWKKLDKNINYSDVKEVSPKAPSKSTLIAGMMISVVPAALIGKSMGTDSVLLMTGIWALYTLPIVIIYLLIIAKRNAPYTMVRQQIQFYSECKDNQITNLSTPAKRQKAELIAQRLGCQGYGDIETFFNDAKRLYHQKDQQDEKQKRVETLLKLETEEEAVYDRLTRYASLEGREKRIRMLADERATLLQKAENLRKGAGIVMKDSQQKEVDWAVHGGIASGLAGPGAGAAAAMDAQLKNARIRAQNQVNMETLTPALMHAWEQARKWENQAQKLQTAIEDTKIKLVADTRKEAVLSELSINVKKVEISETGAFTVKASVSAGRPIMIEQYPAVVDGTISADLYQNGKLAGQAWMVLPAYGVENRAVDVEGICLSGAKKGIPYEVKFTPHLLWEMEK